jgi:hypothetical protein
MRKVLSGDEEIAREKWTENIKRTATTLDKRSSASDKASERRSEREKRGD